MDYTIAFDQERRTISDDGRSYYSDIIYIPAGNTALLSLYNMFNKARLVEGADGEKSLQVNSCIVVHKLSFGETEHIRRAIKCGDFINLADEYKKLLIERRVFHEPVFQCGEAWQINPCNNFALIPTPGFYMLEIFDLNQIDTAYIEYTLLSVADSLAIPDDFKLGNLKTGSA